MLIVYLFKLLVILALGPCYYLVAIAIYGFNKETAREVFKKYMRLIFKTFDVKVSFEFDKPEIQQCTNSILVVLNQSSFLDSLVCPLIPIKQLMGIINIEFAFYPITGWFNTLISFTIIRQWPSQAKRVLNRAGRFLRTGGNMLISIEGKRSRDGKLNEYKKGPIVMAINNQSTIVPVIIYGAMTSLPFASFWIRPGAIRLRFLNPISTQGLSYEDRNSLLEQVINIAKKEGFTFRDSSLHA